MSHHSHVAIPAPGGVIGGALSAICGPLAIATASNDTISTAAWIGLATGVILAAASFGGQVVVPLIRIWVEAKEADRKSAEERHALSNRLHTATLDLEIAKARIVELEAKVLPDNTASTVDRQR